ncbi:Serine/threonine-protein kinase ZRK7 [Hirschfeldia incana]|nr:Serine/threonine-protein kinase ZRK7 [Hirschfeldia incana]
MLCLSRRKKEKKQKKINLQKNGSLLLEELIESSGGKYNPIRTFSSHQILQATDNFNWSNTICQDRFVWYKGTIENRTVLIKNYKEEPFNFGADNIYRDIAVSSMMSSHKNVLKLLGCCLEFPSPVLVCEYPENGALTYVYAGEGIKPLAWNVRLKIVREIADAVTYLHTQFPRSIINRDLKLRNIFLEENWSAKLSSFSLSIPIPEGESGVNDMVVGTTGYAEPEYMATGFVTENVDVYNLGSMMLSLLTGKSLINHRRYEDDSYELLPDYVEECLRQGMFTKLIDPSMGDNVPDHSRAQMEALAELALRCVGLRPGEDKPCMIDVAKELKNIEKQP